MSEIGGFWPKPTSSDRQSATAVIWTDADKPRGSASISQHQPPFGIGHPNILERLVALDKQCALEEKTGKIKWLRPDYQIPRFGSDVERARLDEERRQSRAADKPRYPTNNELAETAAVMHALAAANQPIAITEIARTFSQGRQIEKRVASTILALARLGHLSLPDGGETFALRRSG